MVDCVVRIHPNGTGLESIGHLHMRVLAQSIWTMTLRILSTYLNCGVQVLSVHSRSKAIVCVVSYANGVFFGLELGNRAYRSEDFFLLDLHILKDVSVTKPRRNMLHCAAHLCDIREDCWLDKVSFIAFASPTSLDFGTCGLAGVDVANTLSTTVRNRKQQPYLITRSNWTLETCGPWNVSLANGSPTLFARARSANRLTNSS